MNDALEILNEIYSIISYSKDEDVLLEDVRNYIDNKRLEFESPNGDCCG